jgi:pSer/pThr/pTyr-binding forkhead associated (FHA) protein
MEKRTLVGSLTPDQEPDRVFPLLDSELFIGRVPENNIALPDPSVSSKHAKITRTPEGFMIEDLQSRNGTFVNGEKVSGKRLLADGELIRIGRIVLLFNVAKESSASATTYAEIPVK